MFFIVTHASVRFYSELVLFRGILNFSSAPHLKGSGKSNVTIRVDLPACVHLAVMEES